ncbi:MAG TPA: hypothetical protein VME67_25185 [Mycobacterium sp.]|nr:hypothetical protein [Mycobacterium sp.]HTX97838.1 hypothetical protein [Mycobacterium sp.]
MTETTQKTVVERAAGLSDDVLESIETGRKAAIESVRKFINALEEATPALVDPVRRKTVIDAALDLAEELSAARIEFLRSMVRNAADTVKD